MHQSVCVIVTVWNQVDKTLNCLESVFAQDYAAVDVVVVNNGSTDDTVAQITRRFPRVTLLNLPENLGPTGGYNIGFRHGLAADYPYLFLLNNDTLLAPDCIRLLVEGLESAPDVGLVMPKIYYADDPQRIWSVGGRRNPLTLEISRPAEDQLDIGQCAVAADIDDAPFCAVLFRRAVFENVGLPDEAYFLYYEDIDYCLRARRANYRIRVIPAATMRHVVSASSGGANSPRERYWMARSSVLFFRRHTRGWRWLFVLPWRGGSALRWTVRLLRTGNREALAAYWRGLRDGLRAPGSGA